MYCWSSLELIITWNNSFRLLCQHRFKMLLYIVNIPAYWTSEGKRTSLHSSQQTKSNSNIIWMLLNMPLFQKLTQIKMFHYPTSNSSNKYMDWQVFDRALHKFWGAVRYVPHVQKEDFLVNSIIYLIASKKISRGWKTLYILKSIIKLYRTTFHRYKVLIRPIKGCILCFLFCDLSILYQITSSALMMWFMDSTNLMNLPWTLYRSNRLFGTFFEFSFPWKAQLFCIW